MTQPSTTTPPPTGDQCSANTPYAIDIGGQRVEGFAIWYPQMNGYVAKAVVVPDGDCFEAYVWHDGSFPFDSEALWQDEVRNPAHLHHCDPAQFIYFGETVGRLFGEDGWSRETPAKDSFYLIAFRRKGMPRHFVTTTEFRCGRWYADARLDAASMRTPLEPEWVRAWTELPAAPDRDPPFGAREEASA